jgi:hypothetical protein
MLNAPTLNALTLKCVGHHCHVCAAERTLFPAHRLPAGGPVQPPAAPMHLFCSTHPVEGGWGSMPPPHQARCPTQCSMPQLGAPPPSPHRPTHPCQDTEAVRREPFALFCDEDANGCHLEARRWIGIG